MSGLARRRSADIEAPGFTLVKRAMTEAEYQAMSRRARPEWHHAIYVALQLWERNPRPGSRVRPEWMPLQVLFDLFAEYGVDDPDAIIATIWKCEQMTGNVVQRNMEIDGVVHPAVKYVGPPLVEPPAALPGLPRSAAMLEAARKEIGP